MVSSGASSGGASCAQEAKIIATRTAPNRCTIIHEIAFRTVVVSLFVAGDYYMAGRVRGPLHRKYSTTGEAGRQAPKARCRRHRPTAALASSPLGTMHEDEEVPVPGQPEAPQIAGWGPLVQVAVAAQAQLLQVDYSDVVWREVFAEELAANSGETRCAVCRQQGERSRSLLLIEEVGIREFAGRNSGGRAG